MEQPIIQIKNVTKTFQTRENRVEALKNINLEINKGDIYGIIGMSGAGKSTLVRCLNFLEKPTGGTVLIEGQDLSACTDKELRKVRNSVAMIFQHFNLLMQKNVLENVCFPLYIQGKSKKDAKKRAKELLDIVGLGDRTGAFPAQLSGGQKQRVAIARALISKPAIILADEPTGALDSRSGIQVMSLFQQLNEEGVTIIMITHHLDEAVKSDRIVVMNAGQIILEGTPKEVFAEKELLESVKLDVPFAVKASYDLKQKGILSEICTSDEELMGELCKLNLNQ